MNFTATIDNVTASQWGLNVQQAYAFSWVHQLASWAEHRIVDDSIFYYASRQKFIEDMPLLTDREDTVYRILKQFVEMGLIEMQKFGRKDFISLTQKGKKWGKEKLVLDTDLSESRKSIRANSENNPKDTLVYNQNTNNPISSPNDSAQQMPHEESPPNSAAPPLTDGEKFTEWVIKKIAPVPVSATTIPQIAPMYNKFIKQGYVKEDIKMAVEFAVSDDFWKDQFLSPMKLDTKDKNKQRYLDIFIAKAKIRKQAKKQPATDLPYVS